MTTTRDRFVEFCRQQGGRKFSYYDVDRCALAQFGQSLYPGWKVVAGIAGFSVQGGPDVVVLDDYEEALIVSSSRTFAEIATRMEARKP